MSDILKQNAAAVRSALDDQNKKLDRFETDLKNLLRSHAMLQADYNDFKMKTFQDAAQRFNGGATSIEG